MTDCVGICLSQWVDRARAMHAPTWQEWGQETMTTLQEYQVRRAEALGLLERAQYALLDHDLDTIRDNLGVLKGLL